MGERVDPKRRVTFEELLRACLYEQEALRRVLVRKGPVSNEEVLDEIKRVRLQMEASGRGKPGAFGAECERRWTSCMTTGETKRRMVPAPAGEGAQG